MNYALQTLQHRSCESKHTPHFRVQLHSQACLPDWALSLPKGWQPCKTEQSSLHPRSADSDIHDEWNTKGSKCCSIPTRNAFIRITTIVILSLEKPPSETQLVLQPNSHLLHNQVHLGPKVPDYKRIWGQFHWRWGQQLILGEGKDTSTRDQLYLSRFSHIYLVCFPVLFFSSRKGKSGREKEGESHVLPTHLQKMSSHHNCHIPAGLRPLPFKISVASNAAKMLSAYLRGSWITLRMKFTNWKKVK